MAPVKITAGWVAIIVSAAPAKAPRSIKEVLRIIRGTFSCFLSPTMVTDRRQPVF